MAHVGMEGMELQQATQQQMLDALSQLAQSVHSLHHAVAALSQARYGGLDHRADGCDTSAASSAEEVRPGSSRSCVASVWQRIKRSMLFRYVKGSGVSPEDVDGIMNTMTLVTALVMTIPFGMLSFLGPSTWEWISDASAACPETDSPPRITAHAIYLSVYALMNVCLFR